MITLIDSGSSNSFIIDIEFACRARCTILQDSNAQVKPANDSLLIYDQQVQISWFTQATYLQLICGLLSW